MRIRVGEEKGEHLEDARGVYTVSVRIHFINERYPTKRRDCQSNPFLVHSRTHDVLARGNGRVCLILLQIPGVYFVLVTTDRDATGNILVPHA